MGDRIDHRDQILLARELAELLVHSEELYGFNDEAVGRLLDDDTMFPVFKNAWMSHPGGAVIDEAEKDALITAGFTQEFLDEFAGDDGKKVLRKRVKHLAENSVPPIITLFRKNADYYLHNILELKHFDDDAEVSVPYLEKVLDTDDEGLVYFALRTLSSVGIPSAKTLETGARYCAAMTGTRYYYYARGISTSYTDYDCEEIFITMLERAKSAKAALHAIEEYFKKRYVLNHDKFVEQFAKFGQEGVPYLLRMLDASSYLSITTALEVLNRINYRPTTDIKEKLVKLYHNIDSLWRAYSTNNLTIVAILSENRALIARLLLLAGDRKYMDEMLAVTFAKVHHGIVNTDILEIFGAEAFDSIVAFLADPELSGNDAMTSIPYFVYVVRNYADQVAGKLLTLADEENEKIAVFALRGLQYDVPELGTEEVDKAYDIFTRTDRDLFTTKGYVVGAHWALKGDVMEHVLAVNWKKAAPRINSGLDVSDINLWIHTFHIIGEAGIAAGGEFDRVAGFLDYPDNRVRGGAIRAIGKIGAGKKETIDILAPYLLDSDPDLVMAAVGAIDDCLTDPAMGWRILPSLEHILNARVLADVARQAVEKIKDRIEGSQL